MIPPCPACGSTDVHLRRDVRETVDAALEAQQAD